MNFRKNDFAAAAGRLFILVSCLLILPFSFSPAAAGGTALWNYQVGCEQIIDQLLRSEDIIDWLVDPFVLDEGVLVEKLVYYSDVYLCLGSINGELSEKLTDILKLSEYFLVFAGGHDTISEFSRLELVDLSTSQDPAIIEIRDQANVPPPDGPIFVRYYQSLDTMPGLIRPSFAEDTAGVTILTRYIAILDEEHASWQEQALQAQTLPETVSHELVHAYLNATVGEESFDFPRWYSEGIAIYFSGSADAHSVIGRGLTIYQTPPQDYKSYANAFKYLEAQLGREALLGSIRRSILNVHPSLVYQDLGFTEDAAFLDGVESYWNRRITITGAVILLFLILAGGLFYLLMPDTRCQNCGHTGKRRQFVDGFCPECGYPHHKPEVPR